MVLDLVVETIYDVVLDRRDDRTRLETASLTVGFVCLLVGGWTTLTAESAVGVLVIVAGGLLIFYGW